ncbi:MAG TPA: hypothetical protein PKA10_10155 [Selenomonadales bacterium]|nr:hypothetical protein [Selenomonadales bacterium]
MAAAVAQKWRQDAVLSSISVYLRGTEAVKSRKGEIVYSYYVLNNDSEAIPKHGVKLQLI